MSGVIRVFTDGSCIDNGRKGARAACAVVFPDREAQDRCEALPAEPTPSNNRAELMGAIRALEAVEREVDPGGARELQLYTDSMLLVNTVNEWMAQWKARGWRRGPRGKAEVANLDLVQRLDALKAASARRVVLLHVRAHTGRKDWRSVWNARADELARSCCGSSSS